MPRREQESTDLGAGRLCRGLLLGRLRLGAGERPRWDFGEEAAAAHAHDLARSDRQSGYESFEHPIKAVYFGRARAARQPKHHPLRNMAEEQQIAGVDRHPEMVDPATRGDDGRRDHVAPVDDRRRAVDQQDLDPMAHRIADQRRQLGGRVSAALFEAQRAAERRQTALGDLPGLVEDALLQSRQPRLNKADR